MPLAIPNLSAGTLLSAFARRQDLRLSAQLAQRDRLSARLTGASDDARVMAPVTGAEVLLTHSAAPPAGWLTGGIAHSLRATDPWWAMLFSGGGPPCGRFGSSAATSGATPPYDTQSGVGMSDPGGDLSGAAWVRFTRARGASFEDVIDTREPGVRSWRLRRAPARLSNSLVFQYVSDPGPARQFGYAAALALDTWYLLGFSWEAAAVSLWIDGVRVGRDASPSTTRAAIHAAGFNGQRFDVGDFTGGFVAAAAVWRRALAAAEWAALYAAASPSGGLGGLDYRSFVSLSRPVVRDHLDSGGLSPALGTALRPCGAATRSPAEGSSIAVPGLLKRAAGAPLSLSIFLRADRLDTLDQTFDVRLPASDPDVPEGASPVLWRRTLSWVLAGGVQVLDTAADGHLIDGRRIEGCRLTAASFQVLFDTLPDAAEYADVEVLLVRVSAQGAISSGTHRYQLRTGTRNTALHYLQWTGAGVAALLREVQAGNAGWRMLVVDGAYANYDEPNATWKPRASRLQLLAHGDPSTGPAQTLTLILSGGAGALSVNLALGSPRIGVFSPARWEYRGDAVLLDEYFVMAAPAIQLYDGDPRLVYQTAEDGSGVRVREAYATSTGVMGIECAARLPAADAAGLAMLVVAGDEYWAARLDQTDGSTEPQYTGRFLRGDYAGLRAALVRNRSVVVRLVRADAAGVDAATWEWTPGGGRHLLRWELFGASAQHDPVRLDMEMHEDGAWHQVGLSVDVRGGGVRGILDGAAAASHSGRISGSVWAATTPVGDTGALAYRVLAARTFGGTVLETVRGNLYASNDQSGFIGADGSRVYLHRVLVSYTAVPGSSPATYRVVALVSSTAGGHYTAAADAACAGLIFLIRVYRGDDVGTLSFALDPAGSRNTGGDRAFVTTASVVGTFTGAGIPSGFDLVVIRPGQGYDPTRATVPEGGTDLTTLSWAVDSVTGLPLPDASLLGSGAVAWDEAAGWGRALSVSEFADAWALRGIERLFGGHVDGPQRRWPRGSHQLEVGIEAVGYARELEDRRIEGRLRLPEGTRLDDALQQVFGFSGVAGAASADLDGGGSAAVPPLPVTTSRVPPAAAALRVGPVVFDYQSPAEALDWLADQTGGVWGVDPYGSLDFRIGRTIAAAADLTGEADVAAEGVSVESDEAHLRTRQIVVGGPAPATDSWERFVGGGAVDASDLRWVASAAGYIRLVIRGAVLVRSNGDVSFPGSGATIPAALTVLSATLETASGDLRVLTNRGAAWPRAFRLVLFRIAGGRLAATRTFLPASVRGPDLQRNFRWFANDAAALRRDFVAGTQFVLAIIDENGAGYTPTYLLRVAGGNRRMVQAPDGARRTWDLGAAVTAVRRIQTRRPASAAPVLEAGDEFDTAPDAADKWVFDSPSGTITQAATEAVLTAADLLEVQFVTESPIIVSLTSPTIRTYGRLITAIEQDAGLLTLAEAETRCRALLSSNDHVSLSLDLPLVPGRGDAIRPGRGVRVMRVADVDARVVWLVRSVSLAITVDAGGVTRFVASLALRADDTPYDYALGAVFQGHLPESTAERARHLARLVRPSVSAG